MAYRGNGHGGGGLMSKDMTLAERRAALSPAQKKMAKAVLEAVEAEFLMALEELNAGVATSARTASFSATVQVKGAKRGRFRATIACRVRTPRDPVELDMHVGEDGQLSLGLPKGYTEDAGDAGDEGEDEAPIDE